MSDFSLTRAERMRGDKVISALFTEGRTGFVFPFKYYYLETEGATYDAPVAMLVSVPKRIFKRAVKRNLLKRRMREAYRIEKKSLADVCREKGKKLHIAFVYTSKEEIGFGRVHVSMRRVLAAVEKDIRQERLP